MESNNEQIEKFKKALENVRFEVDTKEVWEKVKENLPTKKEPNPGA